MFRCSYIESKPETGVAKTKDYIEGGDTTQKKYILGGDTAHTLLMRGKIGVGTPHILYLLRGIIGVGTPHILC